MIKIAAPVYALLMRLFKDSVTGLQSHVTDTISRTFAKISWGVWNETS